MNSRTTRTSELSVLAQPNSSSTTCFCKRTSTASLLPVSRAFPFACFQVLSSRGLGQTFSVPSQPIHSANSHRYTMLLLMRK